MVNPAISQRYELALETVRSCPQCFHGRGADARSDRGTPGSSEETCERQGGQRRSRIMPWWIASAIRNSSSSAMSTAS